jgi:hypothetical protein
MRPSELSGLQTFFKLLRYDLWAGFSQNKAKYLVALLAFITLCVLYRSQTQTLWVDDGKGGLQLFSGGRSISDYLIFMFKGIDVYVPSPSNPFTVPIFWMILQVLVAFLVSVYPTDDLRTYALNVLTRVRSRRVWWAAKIVWTVLTVCSFYLLCLAVVVVFALLTGDGALLPISAISLYSNGIDALALSSAELCGILLLPVFVSVALSVAQVSLSFVIKPALSFLSVMAYCTASAYLYSPFLLGDYSMILRNGLVMGGGLSSALMMAISALVTTLFAVAGTRYFLRKNIM